MAQWIVGTQPVVNVQVGSTEVEKVYTGDQVIFEANPIMLLCIDSGTNLHSINTNNGTSEVLATLPATITSGKCLAQHNGKLYLINAISTPQLWEINMEDFTGTNLGSLPFNMPAIDGMASVNGMLVLIDSGSDRKVWRINIDLPAQSIKFSGSYSSTITSPGGATHSGNSRLTRLYFTNQQVQGGFNVSRVYRFTLPSISASSGTQNIFPSTELNSVRNYAEHDGDFYAIGTNAAQGDNSLELWRTHNASDPEDAVMLGNTTSITSPQGLTSYDPSITPRTRTRRLYCVNNDADDLWVINTSSPGSSYRLRDLPGSLNSPRGLCAVGSFLFCFDYGDNSIWLLDPNDDDNDFKLGTTTIPSTHGGFSMEWHNNNLYVAASHPTLNEDDHLWRVNLQALSATDLGELPFTGAWGMASTGSTLYITDRGSSPKLWTVNTSNPGNSSSESLPGSLRNPDGLAWHNNTMYAVDNDGNNSELWRIDLSDPSDSSNIGDVHNNLDGPSGLASFVS